MEIKVQEINHPKLVSDENKYKNYQRIEVPFLEKEMNDLILMRTQEVADMEAKKKL
jgi:hypothetical protein